MIQNKIENLKDILDEGIICKIATFIEQVKSNEFGIGQWRHFDNDQTLKAIALNKSNPNEDIKEYHKLFTDIHITLSGIDTIFMGNQIEEIVENYQELSDYALVKSPSISSSNVLPNYFALIKPGEIHCNVLDNENALKVVIKIIEKCQK